VTTAPLHGTATVTPTGLVTYTPQPGFSGSDSFILTATDTGTPPLTGTVTITVTVIPRNHPPQLTAATLSTATDLPGTTQVLITDPDAGDSTTLVVSTAPLHGTVTVTPTGLVTYTPLPGFSGSDSLTITATDTGTPPLTGVVTIAVTVLSLDEVVQTIAAGAMRFLRAILDPATTGGLPRNEATASQLDSGTFPAQDFFTPAQLGTWLTAAVLARRYREVNPAFTAGFTTTEYHTQVTAVVMALEHILATPTSHFADSRTGGKALYQVHLTPSGVPPRQTDFERTVPLLDNVVLFLGLYVAAGDLAPRDPMLAGRLTTLLGQFRLAMWVEGDTVYSGGPDNPRLMRVGERITALVRLPLVTLRASGTLTPAAFRTRILAMLAESQATVTPGGVAVARLPFLGTASDIWAATPYLPVELTTRFGTETLAPLVTAWEETRLRLGLPAAGATGISDGFGHFLFFSLSPEEHPLPPLSDQLVLIPPATGMQAGAMGTPDALRNLARAFLALRAAGQFHLLFGVPNALDVGDTGLVNTADPDRGTLEMGQMAVALLNYLLPPAQQLDPLLGREAGWPAALEEYAPLLDSLLREAEDAPAGTGGSRIPRGNASRGLVWHLNLGEEARYTIPVEVPEAYTLVVRYSNDDTGVGDDVEVRVDGAVVGTFHTQNTGSGGAGWNVFVEAPLLSVGALAAGPHTITLRIVTSDGFGVDLDRLTLIPVP
jgi:hypothetical protein